MCTRLQYTAEITLLYMARAGIHNSVKACEVRNLGKPRTEKKVVSVALQQSRRGSGWSLEGEILRHLKHAAIFMAFVLFLNTHTLTHTHTRTSCHDVS